MYSKWNKIALAIAAVIMAAGLVLGIAVGPKGVGELGKQKMVTLDMGGGFIDTVVVDAFEKAGVAPVQLYKGGEAESEPSLAFVRVPNSTTTVPMSVVDELREMHPDIVAGAVEEISPAVNLGHWALKAALAAGICALLILLWGTIRYRWAGALRMLVSVAIAVAVTLSLGVLLRIPLGFGFLGALGLTAAFALLQSADWQANAIRLTQEHGNWNLERIEEEVISSSMARRVLAGVAGLAVLGVLIAAGISTTMAGMSLLGALGVVVTVLLSIALDGFWWKKIQRA